MNIQEKLVSFIKERNDEDENFSLLFDQDIELTGYLDSMGFIGLVAFIEAENGQDTDKLIANPEKYRTINQIVELCFAGNESE